jgi:Cyclic nucleotide-binding domain
VGRPIDLHRGSDAQSIQVGIGRQAGSGTSRPVTDGLRAGPIGGKRQHAWRTRLASQLMWIQHAYFGNPAPASEVPAPVNNQEKSRSPASAATSFWNSLDPLEQHAFRALADERTFAGGARLMREGEKANYVIVILRGRVKICVGEGSAEHVIAERGPGQLVGERAILQVSVRSATVVALEMVQALVMRTSDFAAFISAHPTVLHIVESQVYERLTERPRRYGHGHVRYVDQAEPSGRQPPAARAGGRPHLLNGQNCTVVFTDVVAFGSLKRTDEHRRIIRRELFDMTSVSFRDIWDQCYWEDRGDGHLIVVPPTVPTRQVLDCLGGALPVALRRHNHLYAAGARIRLKVAVNVGPVTSDTQGVSGQVIINATRLLEAPSLKDAIAANRANLGIIVSDFVHESAIRYHGSQASPGAYAEVEVNVKEASLRAWVQVIDPVLPAPPPPRPLAPSPVQPGQPGQPGPYRPEQDGLCATRDWVGCSG